MFIHISIFKFKSLLHINNIGSGLISFVVVLSSSQPRSTGHITRDTRATHVSRGVKSAPAAATGARHVCRVAVPGDH